MLDEGPILLVFNSLSYMRELSRRCSQFLEYLKLQIKSWPGLDIWEELPKSLGGVPEHGSRKLSVGRVPGKPRYPLPMNGHSPRQPAPGDRN